MYVVKDNSTTGKPEVHDANGNVVPNSRVHKIRFPYQAVHTKDGPVYEISGPATADITANGAFHTGVPYR